MSKPRGMKLVLSRVEEKDWDELLEVQYTSFKDVDIHQALFGPNTQENRLRVKQAFIAESRNDISDCWLKLVDLTTNRIVSASQWKIYPSWKDKTEKGLFEAPFYEGQVRRDAEELGRDFMVRREKYQYGSPHVCKLFANLYLHFQKYNFLY
jgi:hypothetical protein